MKNILVTGAQGFIGKNLLDALSKKEEINIKAFDVNDNEKKLMSYLQDTDFIFHLAGVNRPKNSNDFEIVNTGFTQTIVQLLEQLNKAVPIVMTSSIQAELNNPYGVSKRKAEDILIQYSKKFNCPVYLFRLPNVFGKWCRPNYNSVVATFCYNISHGLDIVISNREKEIVLVYIDDVIKEFIKVMDMNESLNNKRYYYEIKKKFKIKLGKLVEVLYSFDRIRKNLTIPDLSNDLIKYLYSTYLSYLDKNDFAYTLNMKKDQRGMLCELFKSKQFGQIFISTTHKGVIRGNHYHNTKIEKFCIIKGKAKIMLRSIMSKEIISYNVFGDKIQIIDIPPGYTHSIENVGNDELIVLFWASEIFNPKKPDTYYNEV